MGEKASLAVLQPLSAAEEAVVLERILEKRRRKARKRPKAPKINMTPMIDVVFLLIIFFMLVTELQKMEIEAITLPFALKAKDDDDPEPNRIIVNVTDKGKIRVMRRRVSSPQLRNLLKARADLSPRDADNLPTLAVKVRADANCEYKHVQDVMVQCMRAYIWNLSFGASPVDREGMLLY